MELLNEMAVFARVVERGSFSGAARDLGMTTSAVSRHVSRLEAHIGARLLHRTTRSLALTELGRDVHAGCLRIVDTAREIGALAGQYGEAPRGVLRVTAPVVFGQVWLAPRLPAFLERYPQVDLQVTLVDRMVDLAEEGVDLAIRIARELSPGWVARPLCAVGYRLIAAPSYLAAHGAPSEPAQLPAHRCLYLGYGAFGDRWSLGRGEERAEVRVPTRLTLNNSAAILAAVEAGGGIGLVPDFAAHAALAAGRVLPVLADWQFREPYVGTVSAVYLSGRHLPLKIRVFIDYLLETVEAV